MEWWLLILIPVGLWAGYKLLVKLAGHKDWYSDNNEPEDDR